MHLGQAKYRDSPLQYEIPFLAARALSNSDNYLLVRPSLFRLYYLLRSSAFTRSATLILLSLNSAQCGTGVNTSRSDNEF